MISVIIGVLSATFALYYFVKGQYCIANYFFILAVGMLIVTKDE